MPTRIGSLGSNSELLLGFHPCHKFENSRVTKLGNSENSKVVLTIPEIMLKHKGIVLQPRKSTKCRELFLIEGVMTFFRIKRDYTLYIIAIVFH